jgi:hypothetical protein
MKLRGQRRLVRSGTLWAVLGLALLVTDCSDGSSLPEFPVFAPTRPFLEEQAERKRRALAIAEFRRRERLKFGIMNQEENLAAWLPIYRRAEHGRKTAHLREQVRAEAFSRFQEQTKAKWLPIQTRIFVSRETLPQRQEVDLEMLRQFQEQTKAKWLPHQTRAFEHRETRDERELQAMVKRLRDAKFPSGTRLPGIDGTPRRAP